MSVDSACAELQETARRSTRLSLNRQRAKCRACSLHTRCASQPVHLAHASRSSQPLGIVEIGALCSLLPSWARWKGRTSCLPSSTAGVRRAQAGETGTDQQASLLWRLHIKTAVVSSHAELVWRAHEFFTKIKRASPCQELRGRIPILLCGRAARQCPRLRPAPQFCTVPHQSTVTPGDICAMMRTRSVVAWRVASSRARC